MTLFMVNSKIPKNELNRLTCMIGTSDVFERTGIKDVHLKTCYCCSPELKVNMQKAIIMFEAPSKEALAAALQKIAFPAGSIVEVKKVELPKK